MMSLLRPNYVPGDKPLLSSSSLKTFFSLLLFPLIFFLLPRPAPFLFLLPPTPTPEPSLSLFQVIDTLFRFLSGQAACTHKPFSSSNPGRLNHPQ